MLAATLIAVGAAVLVQEPVEEPLREGGRFFPGLLATVNNVQKVLVRARDYQVTLVRKGNDWSIKEKGGFPAAQENVRGLIIGLARLEKIEAKTTNRDLYSELGVQGGDELAAGAMLVELVGENDKQLAAVIIGKYKAAPGGGAAAQVYVRRPDDNQAWLVEGNVPRTVAVRDWLQSEIINLARSRVRAVSVMHADGEQVTVSKAKPEDADYQLQGLAPDEQVESVYDVNRIVDSLVSLSAVDVLPASAYREGGGKTGAATIKLSTFDGLQVLLRVERSGDSVHVRLSASFDEASAWKGRDVSATGDDNTKQDPAAQASKPAQGAEADAVEKPRSDMKPAAEVRQEVAEMNKQWAPWVYQVPAYSVDNLAVRKSDLLKKATADKNNDPAKKAGNARKP